MMILPIRATIFGPIYVLLRRLIIRLFEWMSKLQNKPFDLENVIDFGDKQLYIINKTIGPLVFNNNIPQNIATEIFHLRFPSPLTFAAFKDDLNLIDTWLKLGMGGGCLKTVLSTPEIGNPRPRIREVIHHNQECLLNALGLPGKGIKELFPHLKQSAIFSYQRPVGISIGGFSINEYCTNAAHVKLEMEKQNISNYYIELNLSCPNLHKRKKLVITPELLHTLVTSIRKEFTGVLSIKCSPDLSDKELRAQIDAIESEDLILLNLGNTQFKTWDDLNISPPSFSVPGGGLSGPPLLKRTLEMVKIANEYKIPTIATGGISTAEDASASLAAGAQLVGIATALIKNPFCIPKMNAILSKNKSL